MMFGIAKESVSLEEMIEICSVFMEKYGKLDSNLSEGDACRQKFNNSWQGVPKELRDSFDKLSKDIRENPQRYVEISGKARLAIADSLALASNHLDQQTSEVENTKPSEDLKKKMVLHWLTAATILLPQYSDELLKTDDDSLQLLSSMAQIYNFYGKALRYNLDKPGVTSEEKLEVFEKQLQELTSAVAMATFLDNHADKNQDPHAYSNRLPTYSLPVIYTLRHLKRYDEALKCSTALLNHALKGNDDYPKIQPLVQLSLIYKEKFAEDKCYMFIEKAVEFAEKSYEVATKVNNSLLKYNARTALIECYGINNQIEEAIQLAEETIADHATNKNCGAKEYHIDAAKLFIKEHAEANQPSCSF